MTRARRIHGGILLFIILLEFNQAVCAEGLTGLYVGGSIGVAKIATDTAAYQNELVSSVDGFGVLEFTSSTLEDRKTAWWVNTGYMAWPFLGIDVSYLHLGELYYQAFGTYAPDGGTSESVGATTRLKSQGPALGLLFQLPLLEHFNLNLRIADYYARTTLTNILTLPTSYTPIVQTANGSSLLLGLGASYTFAGHWSARLDYLRVEHAGDSTTGKYNASYLAVGASYNF
jgi:opacity protein-like surface antigen